MDAAPLVEILPSRALPLTPTEEAVIPPAVSAPVLRVAEVIAVLLLIPTAVMLPLVRNEVAVTSATVSGPERPAEAAVNVPLSDRDAAVAAPLTERPPAPPRRDAPLIAPEAVTVLAVTGPFTAMPVVPTTTDSALRVPETVN